MAHHWQSRADVLPSYIVTVDCLVIYENHGEPSLSFLGGWHTGYGKNNFAVIAYCVSWLDSWYLQSSSSYLQYIYLTDQNMPNPYLGLSSYLGGLAATLSSSSSGSTSATLTVQSQTVDGSSINGLWTALSSSGGSLATGFTPMSYSVTVGTTYSGLGRRLWKLHLRPLGRWKHKSYKMDYGVTDDDTDRLLQVIFLLDAHSAIR